MEGDLSYDKMLYTFLLDLFLCFLRFYVIMFCLSKENKEKRTFSLFFSAYVWLFFFFFFSTSPVICNANGHGASPNLSVFFFPLFCCCCCCVCNHQVVYSDKMFVFYGVAGGEGGSHQTYLLESCLASSVYLRNLE
jgi:hypothetical protein